MPRLKHPKPAPPPKVPLEDAATRVRVIAGARKHFFAHGFRGVTMDDLAVELGMSKKTLYVHFPSKNALLEAVLRDKLARAEADMQRATGDVDFTKQLQAMLVTIRGHGEELQPAFLRDLQRETPEFFAIIQTGRAQLIHRYFGALVKAGQKEGRVRKDVPPEFLVEYLLGAVNAILFPQKLGELGMAPKVAFVKVVNVFLEGALANEGRVAK
jgi:AcrR family transcriptional regulator